ncbi:XRE family transcriptional regulator [Limosilactobacillus reuteri]|uniref:XRE family transcriptional regulator n=1 Tax=Limosilactobacillus reuteri TaxID=1598 RepID=UPI002B055350|nr:XRE family transcriptional regulator [Limosilactobacillus reuteri]
MPETLNGRKRIIDYLQQNKISYSQLATMYGMNKQDVADYISGRKQTPAASRFIITLIKAFDLKYEGK